tara:strand:+ start:1953 stop:2822 length:870 start_codon:yes stop_codon:yes gene_type:complete
MINSITKTTNKELYYIMRNYTILDKKEKYLAELYSKDTSKEFYFHTENEKYSFYIDISSPINTMIQIKYINRLPQHGPCKHFPDTLNSDYTYYTYYKLEQVKNLKKKYIFCRIEILNEYDIKIILPLEESGDNYCFLPEIKFINILDHTYICKYINDNIYCSEFMYTQVPYKFSRHELCKFDMKRNGYYWNDNISYQSWQFNTNRQKNNNYYIASITCLQLINIFNTYLPYLRLAFMQYPTIIYDIKRLIFDKLDITNTDNILRILSYKERCNIKRLIPRLIEDVMLYK